MTNEQRKAINRLRRGLDDIWFATLYSQEEMDKDIDTVLSLIKEQQGEIEGLKNKEVLIKRYFKKCDLIKQKDKQIDLYIDELICNEFDRCCQECCRECEKDKDTLKDCIKQYFERKAEE